MSIIQTGETLRRRPGVLGAHSLDHFSFTVPDLAAANDFYQDFGLDTRQEGDRLALYTFGHEHRWGVLEESASKRLAHLSFGVFEDDLPRFRSLLDQAGIVRIAPPPRYGSNGIWFHDPDGNMIELCVAQKSSPDSKSVFGAVSAPPGAAGAPGRSRAPLIRPRRMSHVAIFVADVDRTILFYTQVVGLRLSDRSGDGVAFMHGAHGSEHHMLAIVKSTGAGMHHSSWDVGSVNDVGLGAMQMAEKGFTRGWGLGRHVLGSNYFHYVRDPWGSYAEYSADMDFIPVDTDWPAANHDIFDSLFLWGPAPPSDFITNFELPLP